MVLLLAGVWLHIGYQQFVGGRQGAALALRRKGTCAQSNSFLTRISSTSPTPCEP